MSDGVAAARRAQERVWALQAEGADPNSAPARQAVNRLMACLRGLSEADLSAFEAWKAAAAPKP